MCRVNFNGVEAVELSFLTTGVTTRQTLISFSSALNDRISEEVANVILKSPPDFAHISMLAHTKSMINNVTKSL